MGFNVPPGVAGGVKEGESNESGKAGVTSPLEYSTVLD